MKDKEKKQGKPKSQIEKWNEEFNAKEDKNEFQEDILKEFNKVLSIGKTNLTKTQLLFVELIVENKDEGKVKKIVLMFSKSKAEFLLQRLSHIKYDLVGRIHKTKTNQKKYEKKRKNESKEFLNVQKLNSGGNKMKKENKEKLIMYLEGDLILQLEKEKRLQENLANVEKEVKAVENMISLVKEPEQAS